MRAAEHAEALAPGDEDIRALRDRLFVGQLRSSIRIDLFPHAYPNLYTATLSGLQYWKQLELGVDAQFIGRFGGTEHAAIVDGLYTASAIYHTHGASSVGLSLGFGAPAHAIPAFAAKGWLLLQIASRWSGFFSYAFWQYHDDKTAHIFAPAIGYALSDSVQLELRWWTSILVLQPPMQSSVIDLVNAVSGRVAWRVAAPWVVGMSYTYGPATSIKRRGNIPSCISSRTWSQCLLTGWSRAAGDSRRC